MSRLLRTDEPIDWNLVVTMIPIPFVFNVLLWPLPDQPPTAIRWLVFAVGMALQVGIAFWTAKKSEPEIALTHAFIIGAVGILLVEILELWKSPFPVEANGLLGLVWRPVIVGVRMMFFVWIIQKLFSKTSGDETERLGPSEFT